MENNSGKTLSTVALVLGIVSVALAWWHWVLAILCLACGIAAIVCAVKGKKASVAAGEPTGMATAGLVLGIIGVVLSGIAVACLGCAAATACAITGAVNDMAGELEGGMSELEDIINSLS